MSHLPEDVKQWPRDPYQVLDVQPGTNSRDIKKAYIQLIRVYKPEQYPEQFRRVREAFEAVTEREKYRPATQSNEAEQLPAPASSWAGVPFPGEDAHAGASLDDQLAENWERACAGQEVEAYQRAKSLVERYPNCDDAYLQVYWLLRALPEVDPSASRCDGLIEALKRQQFQGPALELYHREIEENPQETCSPRYLDLLKAARDSVLLLLLEWRWFAASRRKEWHTIVNDVEAYRSRFSPDDMGWIRLWFWACDLIAWGNTQKTNQALKQWGTELDHLAKIHAALERDLTRFDFLRELADAWKRMLLDSSRLPASLPDLIPISWYGTYQELRPVLLRFLQEIAENLPQAVERLDFIRSNYGLLAAQVVRLLDEYQQVHGGPMLPQPEEIDQLFLRFLNGLQQNPNAPVFRSALFEFLCREMLPLDAVLYALEQNKTEAGYANLVVELSEDWSLRIASRANCLFWG